MYSGDELYGDDITSGLEQCKWDCFPKDNAELGSLCSRISVALCDAPGCDIPICEGHRTRHATKSNTDFCPAHKDIASIPKDASDGSQAAPPEAKQS